MCKWSGKRERERTGEKITIKLLTKKYVDIVSIILMLESIRVVYSIVSDKEE